ncbi:MAG: methionine--tRNA ligase [Ktedonobacterales bacterium]
MANKRTTPQKSAAAPRRADPWYITTAIPYVNAKPHLGFALEIILTDALARYHRLNGEDTRFLTGTDDNSLKNVQAAEREGLPTQELVNRNAAAFEALRGPLSLSFDDFIRTSSDPRHRAGVEKLWEACARNGDIYTRPYRGLYCVGCEQFYTEAELVDGNCPEHLTPPEVVEEENYFFRLSRYGDQLRDLITSDKILVTPQTRKNEVLAFINSGLEDFSVSRSQARARGWGIPVPGDASQVMYVWFDALGNYITALDYADEGPLYRRYWLENSHRTQVIGKGILRFHAVYWPAMLLSAGAPPPTAVFTHGYITVEGQKMSKSLGNILDPVALAEQYGADPLRYYLLHEVPPTEDGDFRLERFLRVNNTDLADRLGNLVNRVVSMVGRYYGGSVPTAVEAAATVDDAALIETAQGLGGRVDAAMQRFAPRDALTAIWELVDAANKYVEVSEPWTLAKRRSKGADEQERSGADARLATVLYNLIECIRIVGAACMPFLPTAAQAIAATLAIAPAEAGDGSAWQERLAWGQYAAGTQLKPGAVLFAKRDVPQDA